MGFKRVNDWKKAVWDLGGSKNTTSDTDVELLEVTLQMVIMNLAVI